MSKLSASEFQTWESLYWPDRIPRTIPLQEFSPKEAIPGLSTKWQFRSNAYSISMEKFGRLVDSMAKSLVEKEKPNTVGVSGSDPLAILAGTAVSFVTGISSEILSDPSKVKSSCSTIINQSGTSGDPEKDFQIQASDGSPSSWEPSEPSVSILFPDDIRVIYPLRDLWSAVESFLAFTDLRTEKGIAVVGSPFREFGFFTSISALVSGVPLVFVNNLNELDETSRAQISVLFLGRDVIEKQDKNAVESYRKALGPLGRSFSFAGVEGPINSELTKSLEKACGIPFLQMFGISGRGIVLSNPKEFNVHGSAGIPITNSEAIMADNLEGNWARDRILVGPGSDGELAIRGGFIDGTKDVGDARQNLVKVSIGGQSLEWLATGVMGKMDENGYFYLKEPSFR